MGAVLPSPKEDRKREVVEIEMKRYIYIKNH